MLLQIADILQDHEYQAIADAVSDDGLWRDGRDTAKGQARAVKSNQQADRTAAIVKGVSAKIEKALRANAVFVAAAQPASFGRMMVNRYRDGMAYGDHVDAAYVDGLRTDISFTVFLNDPDSYEGGALVIDHAGYEDAIKGPAGSVVLYPSTAVHRVEAVTKGERLACIGWVKSRVKSPEHRGLIFDVETSLAELRKCNAPAATINRLANVRNNLLRTFGE